MAGTDPASTNAVMRTDEEKAGTVVGRNAARKSEGIIARIVARIIGTAINRQSPSPCRASERDEVEPIGVIASIGVPAGYPRQLRIALGALLLLTRQGISRMSQAGDRRPSCSPATRPGGLLRRQAAGAVEAAAGQTESD